MIAPVFVGLVLMAPFLVAQVESGGLAQKQEGEAATPALAKLRIDPRIETGARKYPLFVRLKKQLFADGKGYPAFCKKNAKRKRSELRKEVLSALHRIAAKGIETVAEDLDALEKQGDVTALRKYWIVNGFSCVASGKTAHRLAELDAVGFVYWMRPPARTMPLPEAAAKRLRGRFQKRLEAWVDDTDAPFSAEGLSIPWNVKRIGAPELWKTYKAYGQGVVIALNDSGLLETPALLEALWRNEKESFNGKDDDGNGYVDDVFGYDFVRRSGYVLGDSPRMPHGSVCAGIMAGRPAGPDKVVTGIAPRARIMVLRGMGNLEAYQYALENGADLFSMSFMFVNRGLSHYRGVYRLAHEHMTAAGIVSLGGAGNFAKRAEKGKQIAVPKDIPCVIAAAGLGKDEKLANFSSRGPCYWDGVKFYDDFPESAPLIKPDVTTYVGGFPCWCRTQRIPRRWRVVWKGTQGVGLVIGPQGNSFAGPHVGGIVALMMSKRPELPAWRFKEILEQTARDLGPKGRDTKFGAGFVNAKKAMSALAH